MRSVRHVCFVILVAGVAAPWCRAQPQSQSQIDVTLPLQGYYRPGRYMPVRVVTNVPRDDPGLVSLRADGAATTLVRPVGRSDNIVPWLPLVSLSNARWSLDGVADGTFAEKLTELTDADVLVCYSGTATATEATAVAAALFPGKNAITLTLDPAEPVKIPVMAWGTMDAVLFDVAPEQFRVGRHVSAGTVVLARAAGAAATAPPDAVWPWRRVGAWWAVSGDVAGSRGPVVPGAYDAAAGWRPGHSAAVRRKVVLWAAAFAIVALALTLWRSRYTWALVVAWCGVGAVAAVTWSARQPGARTALGTVFVDKPLFQADDWLFVRSLKDQEMRAVWEGEITTPAFATPEDAARARVTLHCGRNGAAAEFAWPAPRGSVMAILSRTTYPKELAPARESLAPPADGAPSPLRDFARRAYPRFGTTDRVVGEVRDPRNSVLPAAGVDDWWPAVLVEQSNAPGTTASSP